MSKKPRVIPDELRLVPLDFTWHICRFLRAIGQSDLNGQPGTYSPIPLYLRDNHGRIELSLGIGDRTTGEQLRDAIPLALELRDRLLQHQGPSQGHDQEQDFREWICFQNEAAGQSPASIAKMLNAWLKTYRRENPSEATRLLAMLGYDEGDLPDEGDLDGFRLTGAHIRDRIRAWKHGKVHRANYRDDGISLPG